MTTTTLSDAARRTTALFATGSLLDEVKVKKSYKKNKSGANVLALKDVPVFRSGVFRDSMGFQHTWEDLHMGQMVQNFELLRNQGLFADVPVRKDHPSFLGGNSLDSLIGYHTSLKTERRTNPADGKEYTYILAEYEILDPDAQQKIDSGLWRNRSAEIGSYITNGEAEFWPAYMGVAYVDIPAVEGLNGFMSENTSTQYSMMTEEPVTAPTQTQAPAAPAAPAPPALPATSEHSHTAPPVPTPSPTPTPAPHAFSVNGQNTTDFAAVQAHIANLEAFQKETRESGRKSFAAQLAADNKIPAAEVAEYEKFALSLDDSAYEAWSAMMGKTAANPIFGKYAQQGGGEGTPQVGGTPTASGTPVSAEDQALSDAKDRVRQHGLAGMSPAQIEKTASFAMIRRAEPSFSL